MNIKKFILEQARISFFMLVICAVLLYLRGEYLQAKPWEWHYNCWIATQLFVVWVIGGHMCVSGYRVWEAKYKKKD